MRGAVIALAAAGLVAAVSAVLLARHGGGTVARPATAPPATARKLSGVPPVRAVPAGTASLVLTPADHAFLNDLRGKFAPRFDSKHAQVKAIEQLVAYLQRHYPDDWRERLRSFLQALAPTLLDVLLERFQGLERLNEWLRTNRAELLRLDPVARRAALWAARREAFGDAADEIYAAQKRNEQVADALAAVEAAADRSTAERLDLFVERVQQAYGDQAPAFIAARQTELINRFLDMPSVQDELDRQSADERGATLRTVRAGLGMDEGALARWDDLDRQRDAAWDAGTRYMAERERIMALQDVDERERALAELRTRYFGADAGTISAEEAAGFYRYGQRRRYGRE